MSHFLPEKVRQLRSAKSLSAAELGQLIGVGGRAIYSWERGENTPNVDKLSSLASIFKVSVSYFFDEPPQEDPYYTSDEIELIRSYRLLTDEGKDLVRREIEVFAGLRNVAIAQGDSDDDV